MKLNDRKWKIFYLKDLFQIKMGNGFDKNKMSEDFPTVNFVSRVSYNNGVDSKVDVIEGVPPFPTGYLSVALGGSYLGSCFVQEEPFYTAQNVAVMKPLFPEMSHNVNLFISSLVRYESKIKYYAFGRELNSHINRDFSIELPVKQRDNGALYYDQSCTYSKEGYIPDWEFINSYVRSLHHKPLTTKNQSGQTPQLATDKWKEFKVGKIFRIEPTKGKVTDELIEGDDIPYIAAKHDENGFDMLCAKDSVEDWISKGNCIVFIQLGEGSCGYANYIQEDFVGMNGKTSCGYIDGIMNQYIGLFLATILCQERPKHSFGRSWTGARLTDTIIKLPVQYSADGSPHIDITYKYSDQGYVPDWSFMENYIKQLPYGDRI